MSGKLKNILIALAVGVSLYSCEKDKGPVIIRPVIPIDTLDTFIHFSLYIQPIFDGYCIRCHNESHPNLDLRDGFSFNQLWFDGLNAPYVDTLDPENSILLQHLEGTFLERMPPEPPYPAITQIDTIRQWILQGARNN